MSDEYATQQAWWDSMTPIQREQYEDAQIRGRIERWQLANPDRDISECPYI